jgi:LAS superfamily LD-carboxypeptidase LdcB
MSMLNQDDLTLLTGTSNHSLIPWTGQPKGLTPPLIHPALKGPLDELAAKASGAGFTLAVTSAFRSYDQQLAIWNAKARGERTLLNDAGLPLLFDDLSDRDVLEAIMRWSAIPGASRHHWGTDLDIYDLKSLGADKKLELTPQEVAPSGIMGAFHLWLDGLMKQQNACGFYRPYNRDRGGVAPEKWHLSYRPLAQKFDQAYTLSVFHEVISRPGLLLAEYLHDEIEEIFFRYVKNTAPFPEL